MYLKKTTEHNDYAFINENEIFFDYFYMMLTDPAFKELHGDIKRIIGECFEQVENSRKMNAL